MHTRTLTTRHHGALALSVMGLGGAPLGNLYRAISDAEAEATLAAAFAAGIRYVDTAPQYGLGLSEERFGRALANLGRDQVVLSTKVGRVLEDCAPGEVTPTAFVQTPNRRFYYDYSYDGVMRSYESSLKRLQTDRIDILLIHDVDVFSHGSQALADAKLQELMTQGGYRALEMLRRTGAVKAIGAGVNEWQVCEKLAGMGDFDCFLLAGRYTLLEQQPLDSFLPLCQRRGIGIILGGPYNSGILATGAIAGAHYNYAPAPPAIRARVRSIAAVCEAHGVALVEAAFHFVLGHPCVISVIPGAQSVAEMTRNAAILARRPPAALWTALKNAGLLRDDAPVPDADPESEYAAQH